MLKVDIVDEMFAPGYHINSRVPPKYFEWVRDRPGKSPLRFFTDRRICQVVNYQSDVSAAIHWEPFTVNEVAATASRLREAEPFKFVLTCDTAFKQLLGNKGLWAPSGGCWLEQDQIKIWDKTKLTSLIASAKKDTPGHRLRHEIAGLFPGNLSLFGAGFGNHVKSKVEALAPFMYSVVVESVQLNDYFSEKIIDSFLTGTVPIYWGTDNLKNYFNMDGVLQFNTLDDLDKIMSSIGPVAYYRMAAAVQDNFYRARAYAVYEDWIFETYPEIFQ